MDKEHLKNRVLFWVDDYMYMKMKYIEKMYGLSSPEGKKRYSEIHETTKRERRKVLSIINQHKPKG